ncbi:MAG: transcription antitermination factor NusB [Candidatus Azotimanducaceae bacterium]
MVEAKPNIWQRRRARRALVQALYKWHMTEADLDGILLEFEEGGGLSRADKAFFKEILSYAIETNLELRATIMTCLDREYERLDFVEQAILELATTEFAQRLDVPYRVVIDEYVELAKTFGAQDSYKYINGVLDKIWVDLRKAESV